LVGVIDIEERVADVDCFAVTDCSAAADILSTLLQPVIKSNHKEMISIDIALLLKGIVYRH